MSVVMSGYDRDGLSLEDVARVDGVRWEESAAASSSAAESSSWLPQPATTAALMESVVTAGCN